MRKTGFILMTLAVGLLVRAQGPTGSDPLVRRLPNGLSVILLEDHANPLVASFFVVKIGLRGEDAKTCGTSHLLEHLLFNGTEKYDQKQLYEELDLLGAYNNAFTQEDYTCYVMVAERDRFPQALDLQRQMLFHSVLPPEKVEKERGIILEELAKDSAGPDYALGRAEAEAVFEGTPYALPVLGTPESIKAISRDTLWQYYKDHYAPNNMTLLLVGDFKPTAMWALIRERLGGYPARVVPDEFQPVDLFAGRVPKTVRLDAPQGKLILTFPAPPLADPSRPALEVARRRLADEKSSPLAALLRRLKHESFSLDLTDNRDYALCRLAIDLGPGETVSKETLQELQQGLKSLSLDLDAESLEAARTALEAGEVFSQENIHFFGMLKGGILADLPAEQAAGFLGGCAAARYRPVTAAAVKAQVERLFQSERVLATVLEATPSAAPASRPPAGMTMPPRMGGK